MVFLVGAGPGDEGLITVKGLKAIQEADVILYDRLLNPKLLENAPAHCELIYSGKLPHKHIIKQERINEYLVEKAMDGKVVVRLKGGDPSVFGRVGEEAAALAEHQIPFEIVPGVTAGVAASMYAGIPVTHREFGVSFAIVSAHDASGEQSSVNWEGLVNGVDTIAFYMGVANISTISEKLIQFGKPAKTPVILIQWGTYGRQKTLVGTLEDIANKVLQTGFTNPAITLVGDIVALRHKLKWFEDKPLYGRQILLVRTGIEKSPLAQELKDKGADVIEFPKWKQKKVEVNGAILKALATYQRILFRSPESMNQFFELLYEREIDIRSVQATLYSLSTKSLKALKQRGLIGYLEKEMNQDGKLLIIGDIKEYSDEFFIDKYGQYDFLQTSEKVIDDRFVPVIKQMVSESDIDTVIFPSRLSVDVLLSNGESFGMNVDALLHQSKICCMGPSSKEEVIRHGYTVQYTPSQPTLDEVISCLQT